MCDLCKILIVFVVVAKGAWAIEASPIGESEIALAPMDPDEFGDYTPSPAPYGDEISPESQYPFDEMESPYSEEQYPPTPAPAPEYPYYYYYYQDQYDSPSPAPAPAPEPYYMEYAMAPEVEGVYEYDPPSEAPSETELSGGRGSPSPSPLVMDFDYSGDQENGSSEVSGYEKEKKSGSGRIGIVMGAICVVGLGGLVYNKNQKRKHRVYMKLPNDQV